MKTKPTLKIEKVKKAVEAINGEYEYLTDQQIGELLKMIRTFLKNNTK